MVVNVPPRAWRRLWDNPTAALHRIPQVLPVKGRAWGITLGPGETIPQGLEERIREALRELGYRPRR
ncbi:MAG: hypothetical protein KatS3mg071_1562 [Meiothermus sp.]|nr:MAG: hypothetical protein KatS3mg071_1562 [Meiothermus sp.]